MITPKFYQYIKVEPLSISIPFTSTASPSLINYQTNYLAFGECPQVTIIVDYPDEGCERELLQTPRRYKVGGLLDSIVYDLDSEYTGYIILST